MAEECFKGKEYITPNGKIVTIVKIKKNHLIVKNKKGNYYYLKRRN